MFRTLIFSVEQTCGKKLQHKLSIMTPFTPCYSFSPPSSLTCLFLFIHPTHLFASRLSPFPYVGWLSASGSKCPPPMFLFLVTPGRRTLPEASSSSSLMAWWWHPCQQRFSAKRSCRTLCPTQNTSQVWNHNSSFTHAHSCAIVLHHRPVGKQNYTHKEKPHFSGFITNVKCWVTKS